MPVTLSSARFVGRERELGRIGLALEQAVEGKPSTLLLAASGGLGASRLLAETARRLEPLPTPFRPLRGRAHPAWRGRPWVPLADALGETLAGLPDANLAVVVGRSGEGLVRILPSLRGRLDGLGLLPARPPVPAPERRQTRVLEAFQDVLLRLAAERPVVLMLEDLQHADAATRAALTFMGRTSREGRLVVLASYAPDELTREHPLQADLATLLEGPRPVSRLDLQPLGLDELAELIGGIEGSRPSASLLLLVAERSRGNPLVAEELLAARHELSGASLGGSLDQLVRARVALRSRGCRRLLRLLAVAAGPLDRPSLAAADAAHEMLAPRPAPRSGPAPRRASGGLDGDLAAGLAEALAQGFVVAEAGRAAGPVAFRHELIRRAVVADLLPATRQRYERALALGRRSEPAVALRHWLAAHETAAARDAAVSAASAADAADAAGDALPAYELAIELTASGATEPARPDLVELAAAAAEAAFASGDHHRAVAHAESAVAGLDGRRDRVALGLLSDRLGRYRRAAGDYAGAVVAHERAVALVPRAASRERALVLAGLAQIRMIEGTFSGARQLAEQAIAAAEAVGEGARAEFVHAATTLAVVDAWGDDPETGLARLAQARATAAEAGLLDDVFRAFANQTTILDLLGRREEAVAVARAGVAEAVRVGQSAVYGNFLRGNAADSLFRLGRWDEARSLSTTALDWTQRGMGFLNPLLTLATVEIETTAGEFAGRLLGRLLLETETVAEAQYSARTYAAAASYGLWRDDLPEAGRAIERGWARLRGTEDWTLLAELAAVGLEVQAAIGNEARARGEMARLAEARSRADAMLRHATLAVEAAGVKPEFGSRREADAMLAMARAFRAALDGRDRPAEWAELAARWELLGDPYRAARARRREAEAYLRRGRQDRHLARAPLLAAAEGASALGARPLLRSLQELGARGRIPLPAELTALLAAGYPAAPAIAEIPTPLAQAAGATAATVSGEDGGPGSSLARGFVGEATTPARGNPFNLSAREREVLALIAEGLTNPEIGRRLFISRKTVGVHVSNILAKLGVAGRVEAATVAIRLGLANPA